jgi:formylglycine-generating enzyme required for sulfatase activity
VTGAVFDDPLLRAVPAVEGYKLLPPCLVTGKLGGGGMGMVFRGYHTKLEIDVAIKLLSPLVASQDPRFVERFQREARLAARIAPDNENLIHVYDVAEAYGLHYIVMELVRGETLRERVKRKRKLAQAEALAILLGAANGLAAAHARGVVHRDVKPDNLMVTRAGRVKVADLGLAKADASADQSLSVVMGTPKYMAPEHWSGMENVLPPTDVWALGACGYFMLKGEDPFVGSSQGLRFPDVHRSLPDASPPCRALLAKCVADDPAQRFADAGALRDAIRAQWPEPLVKLADADAGKGSARATTINRPPDETVRAARQTVAVPANAVTVAPRRARTSAPLAQSRAQSARRKILAGAVLLVVLASLAAMWWNRGAGAAEVNELLRRGRKEIADGKSLDAGVRTLLAARRLDAANPDVVAALVDAYRARAELARDPAAALDDAQAAADLSGSAPNKALLEAKKKAVRALLEGFTVQPASGVVGRELDVTVTLQEARLVETVTIGEVKTTPVVGKATATIRFTADGEQTFAVVVMGPHGIDVQRSISILVDGEPPVLTLDAPGNDDTVGGTVNVSGTVRDQTQCTVVVRAPGMADRPLALMEGAFRDDVVVPDDLAGDRFALTVEARDAGARTATVERTVRVDRARPQIKLGDFARRTRQAEVTVQVTAGDAIEVMIGGSPASLAAGAWQGTVRLTEGSNTVAIEVRGRNGVSASTSVVIERDVVAPVLEGLPDELIAGAEVELRGRLSENADVTVDGDAVVRDAMTFTKLLVIDGARTTPVVVVARDACGNESTRAIRVVGKPSVRAATIAGWQYDEVDGTPGAVTKFPLAVRDQKSGIVFRLVEPGAFTMGAPSAYAYDQPPHQVRITRAFYLAATETTVAQWRRIAKDRSGRGQDDHPVTSVSWDHVKEWLQTLNGGNPRGTFRLPTEAEWEFACRAGTTTEYAFGEQLTENDANIKSSGPMVAGARKANAWGFFDMHGNVFEWCEDVYGKDYYKQSPPDDPLGPSAAGNERVIRGGAFDSSPILHRSASRQSRKPNDANARIGFRVARSLQ